MNSISVKQLAAVAAVAVACVPVILVALAGCASLRSDSATALRQNARANRDALISNQAASRQAIPAQPVSGEALLRLLSGNSHVKEYRAAVADAQPYFTSYHYFRPDGVYISSDTYSRRTPGYEAIGSWRVNENLLCVNEINETTDPQCFTLKVTASGVIQYWTHKPGDPFHGLLSSNVEIIRPGLQTPTYVTTQSMYER